MPAAVPDDEKMARAWAIFGEDSDLSGLVQLLAGILHQKGLSLHDLEGGCKRAPSKGERGWADSAVDWWLEMYCWLQQPGVFDWVRQSISCLMHCASTVGFLLTMYTQASEDLAQRMCAHKIPKRVLHTRKLFATRNECIAALFDVVRLNISR